MNHVGVFTSARTPWPLAVRQQEVILIAQRRRQVLRHAKAIKLLMVPERARLLRPFLAGPQTVATAAEQLGVPPAHLTYWVKVFLQFGLLEPSTARLDRVGRTYQAVADEFILLPGNGYPAVELYEMEASRTREYLSEHLKLAAERESAFWAVRVYLDELGYLRRDDIPVASIHEPSPQAPYGVDRFMELRLTEEHYRAFQRDMDALMGQYLQLARADQDAADLKRSLVYMALVRHQD